MENVFFPIWAVLTVFFLFVHNTSAIRVYEGTNFQSPIKPIKTLSISKKSSISKRSWNSEDEKLLKDEQGNWKAISKRTGIEGAPSLYKIIFSDKSYVQYLRYIKDIPRLEEYTFCLWYKFANTGHDQTLFTYSITKNELLLRFWFNAADSTLRMAIRETPVYKVVSVIRENKWYHICQSWNGVLGEWQVFQDGKRIGSGVLSHYSGTYIPEGGEVTLGSELITLNKRLNDGLHGEVFGFNLVDEAVPKDQTVFLNSQYKSNTQGVPPFKKLPPIKKTYNEIKAYISTLPSDPPIIPEKSEGDPSTLLKKSKERVLPKRNRGNHRLRYPPLRKVVVYNRDDRQLQEPLLELNKTRSQNQTIETKQGNQQRNKNYSIHSYRINKDERKNNNYEIYETLEDDRIKTNSEDELAGEQSLERKARENFNLFTARQANKVYTLSSSVKDSKKPRYHFETRTEEPEKSNRRSFVVEKVTTTGIEQPESEDRKIIDVIPVYEVERKKRSTDDLELQRQLTIAKAQEKITNGFRRLPQIPDSFISIFTNNASKVDMEKKLDKFFPEKNTTETKNEPAETETPKVETAVVISLPTTNKERLERYTTESPVPDFSPIPIPSTIQSRENMAQINPAVFTSSLTNQGPVNFPVVQEFNPGSLGEDARASISYNQPKTLETTMERKFDLSSGTDLVMRGYAECTRDRGSSVFDKEHLIISWADTPVRIFGGAQVEEAKNQCGYF